MTARGIRQSGNVWVSARDLSGEDRVKSFSAVVSIDVEAEAGSALSGDGSSAALRARSVGLLSFRHHFKGKIHRSQHGDKGFKSWISSRRCGFV